jgi:hypothetical protein
MVFVLIGVMLVFLVPMVTEKAEALTKSTAIGDRGIKMFNLKYSLNQGKWVTHPHFWQGDIEIRWTTKGSGVFGGTESGSVEVDLKKGVRDQAHAKLSWYNPDQGRNTCGIELTGRDAFYFDNSKCTIQQDTIADAKFNIRSR